MKKSDKEKLIKLINGEIDNLQAVIDRTSSKKSIEWWQREIDHYNKLKEELNPNNFIINKVLVFS